MYHERQYRGFCSLADFSFETILDGQPSFDSDSFSGCCTARNFQAGHGLVMCPWSGEEKKLLLSAIDSYDETSETSETSFSQAYLRLLRNEGKLVLNGLYYREGRGAHHFALILREVEEEGLYRAYQLEIELQRMFPKDSFEFEIYRSAIMGDAEKDNLLEKGYVKVEG